MPFLRSLFILFMTLASMHANTAEWKECERAKLRLIKLEQRSQGSGKSGHKVRSGKISNSRQNAASLDEWLWKNCRSYSSELRRLEQERM